MKNDVISPEFDENGRPLRRIRSFVRRQGRLTKGQQHALDGRLAGGDGESQTGTEFPRH